MMRSVSVALAALVSAIAAPAFAQTIAITNARVLTSGPAGEIANGTVVIQNGRIAAVGAGLRAPAGAEVIDAGGQVVTPGLFATNSLLGATEIRSLDDDLTVNNPDLGAAFDVQYGLDPESTLLPVARLGGITRAVVMPQAAGGGDGEHADDAGDTHDIYTAGGDGSRNRSYALFAGQAAVAHMGKSTDILVKPKVAMVAPFGSAGARVAGGARGAQFVLVKAILADVRDYARNRAAYDRGDYRDLPLSKADLEALIPVVQGRMPLVAEVHKVADIRAVLKLAREENIKVILSGAEEAWKAAPEIAHAGVPVLLNPLNNRPDNFEVLGATLENAARLHAAGVTVAFESTGGAHRARETRYGAGSAVAYGMPYQAALAAVTINPAKIFGVGDRVGSLEVGKEADVVIWSGDPFEPLSQPTAVFVRGQAQPMTSRQWQLRDRYKDLSRPLPPGYSY